MTIANPFRLIEQPAYDFICKIDKFGNIELHPLIRKGVVKLFFEILQEARLKNESET